MPKKFYPFIIENYHINEFGNIEISQIRVYNDDGTFLKTVKSPELEKFVPYLAKNTCLWKPIEMEENYDI